MTTLPYCVCAGATDSMSFRGGVNSEVSKLFFVSFVSQFSSRSLKCIDSAFKFNSYSLEPTYWLIYAKKPCNSSSSICI